LLARRQLANRCHQLRSHLFQFFHRRPGPKWPGET
jgi:hypothetical protein